VGKKEKKGREKERGKRKEGVEVGRGGGDEKLKR
jgi:hypothetical protein